MRRIIFVFTSAILAFLLFRFTAGAFTSTSTTFYIRGESAYLTGTSTSGSFFLLNSAAQSVNGTSSSGSFGILSGPLYTFFGSLTPIYQQAHFHWRNDDGSETAATSATGGSQDTNLTGFTKGTIKRLRYEIANKGGTTKGYSTQQFRLEFGLQSTTCAAASFSQVTTTAAFAMASTTANLTEGGDTTNLATSSNGAVTDANHFFLTPNGGQRKIANQTGALSLDSQSFVELEYAITPQTSAATTTPYCFRVSNAGATSSFSYAVYATTTVADAGSNAAPTVSAVLLNGGSAITLIASTTKSVSVGFTITDTNGCSDVFTGGGVTTTIFRSGVGASCTPDNRNCYATSTQVNNCTSGNSAVATTTIPLYYFAQPTDASSTFSTENWQASVTARDAANATSTATSTGVALNTLLAFNLSTSSIGYGNVGAGSDTGSTNQNVGIYNVGNSSSTFQVSGTALLFGANLIATTSQKYATSSFTYSSGGTAISGILSTIAGFFLSGPTSTSAVFKNTFWGISAPPGNPIGTYNGTTTISAVWSS